MIPGSRLDLVESESIVIHRAIQTGGQFLDEVELQSADFQSNQAAWTYDAIRKMMATGEVIDSFTLALADQRIKAYVWEVSDYATSNADYHAQLVHDAGIRRRLSDFSGAIPEMAKTMEINQLIETVRKHVDDAVGLQRSPITFIGDELDRVLLESTQPRRAFETPWSSLTENFGGGFRPGGLYVVAARPGIGKSALALQMASYLSMHGVVAFSSLEMPKEELIRRVISQGSGVAHQVLERGQEFSPYTQAMIDEWRTRAPVSVAIDDRSGVTIGDIRGFARTLKRHGTLTGIVVDYLQLITGPAGVSRVEQITEITRQLKIMAREMDCPVIALSQLNRKSEDRMDKRPMISDLRDSGSIEQDADCVMLIYRDPNNVPESQTSTQIPIELIVAKNRHGPAQNHDLYWDGAFMRATDRWEP